MPTNEERADWGREACETFAESVRMDMANDLPTIIGDLIANLLHLADQEGLCAESVLRTATMHFEAETGEEKEWSQ
jgi:hypothetical protein